MPPKRNINLIAEKMLSDDRPETLKKDYEIDGYKVGQLIGRGGFADVYSLSKTSENDYKYVVKWRITFYMRNCQPQDIKAYKLKRGLQSVGLPILIKHGVQTFKAKKHRFLIMPRYGESIEQLMKNNGGCLPEQAVYRLAIQMLDCYEYIHSRGYIHGDLKGGNVLLGYGKPDASQAFLLDFGLAHRYTTEETYKRDPKQAHIGTKEYMSRDSHNGVISMRSDMEILAYNLLEWLGARLPWEKLVKDNVAQVDENIQKAKEEFMSNLNANLKSLNVPKAVKDFFVYICGLQHNSKPNYEKTRRFFEDKLKSGVLIFNTVKRDANCDSDSDAGDVIEQDSKLRVRKKKTVSPASKVIEEAAPLTVSSQSLSCSPPKKAKLTSGKKNTRSLHLRTRTISIDFKNTERIMYGKSRAETKDESSSE